MQVKIKKLSENAVIPFYSKEGDAGMDLTATWLSVENTIVSYGTGLAITIPKEYVGLIFPRSSINKHCLILANCVGVIDSGYTGELICKFKLLGGGNIYKVGDRIGQLIIMPYPHIEFEEVDELTTTQRGEGGFGSTN